MKKLYMQPCVEIVTTHPFVHLCQSPVIGGSDNNSGIEEGEEEMAKIRHLSEDEESWGSLW